MNYEVHDNAVVVHDVTALSLPETLDCGQAFRWVENEDNSFTGVAFGKVLRVELLCNDLWLHGSSEEDFLSVWQDYFDLNLDYEQIREDIKTIHPVLSEATEYAPGIRILQQEPWEALCTFIISQNNNIKRIKGIVERLCETFGDRIADGYYSFPSAERLARLTPEDLQPLRAGFRNKYIIDAAKKVADGEVNLENCKTLEYDTARAELCRIKGVGNKVADCTLLFGMHRVEAFPIDVWMKRAMEKLFPDMTANDFGEYAGIAQQYIFHYSRMNPDLFE